MTFQAHPRTPSNGNGEAEDGCSCLWSGLIWIYLLALSLAGFLAVGRSIDMVLIAQTHANTKIKAACVGLMTSSTAETYQDVQKFDRSAMPGMMILAPADAIEYGAMIPWAPEFAGLVYLRVTQEATPPLLALTTDVLKKSYQCGYFRRNQEAPRPNPLAGIEYRSGESAPNDFNGCLVPGLS